MYKLSFFVPPSHVDGVKDAVFAAGGGRIGQYDHCAWQTMGQGQFRALDGSQPFIGQTGQVEYVGEWKVELVVADDLIQAVVVRSSSATRTKHRRMRCGVWLISSPLLYKKAR
mgnify:CR=1 FL=1